MDKHYCPYCMTSVAEGEICSGCGLTAGNYVPSPHHLPPGTILMGRYLVGRVLGEGGFGITYIGCDLRLELKVAIKEYYPCDRATRNAAASLDVISFIGPSAKSFERGKQKFLGEAQVMARMDKQQVIVSVRDFFEINNTAYIVMEYVEGITFRELVEKKGGKIEPEELFPMLEPLFGALSVMHKNGLIHRDISPDNLMLESGNVRLLDFGCARETSQGTETLTIALKHGYAPIEQYQRNGGQGPWTDIYALCATIYYCLTGKVPPQALDRISGDELLLPGKLGVNLTEGQERALLKGMRIQPNCRFSTVEELWAGLYGQPAPEKAQEPKETGNAEEPERTGNAEEPKELNKLEELENPQKREGTEKAEEAQEPEKLRELEKFEELKEPREPENPEEPAKSEEASKQDRQGIPLLQGRGKRYLLAGIAAACAVLLISFIGYHNRVKETVNPEAQDATHSNSAEAAGSNTSGLEGRTEADIFTEAVSFSGGDEAELLRLLADDSVSAVILDCSAVSLSEPLTIAKPVLVAEGTVCEAFNLTVAPEGMLRVEGILDMSEPGFLRLEGEGLRLCIAQQGKLYADGALVWMDGEDALAGEDGTEIDVPRRLVFSEEVFEGEDVVSILDYESLVKAAEQRQVISIDGNLTLEGDIWFSSPVRISEGVTVHSTFYNNGIYDSGYYRLGILDGGILVNNGSFDGHNLYAEGSAAVINRGLLTGEYSRASGNDNCVSLWIEEESVLVNYGKVEAGEVSRFWDSALCLNMETGVFNLYDFYLVGGSMANCGQITLPEAREDGYSPSFSIRNGSRLVNCRGGVITVGAHARFENNANLMNLGNMVVKEEGNFHNTVLENNGFFQAERGSHLDEGNAGIYCGSGEYDIKNADIRVYAFDYRSAVREGDRVALADDEETLRQALISTDVEEVYVTADILLQENLTLRKNLYIAEGCSLNMAEGTALSGYGCVLALGEKASLHGGAISFYNDAQLCMRSGSLLEVEKGGMLTLDSSLLWSRQGIVHMENAGLTLKNRGGFWLDASSMEADGGEILLQSGAAFVVSGAEERMNLAGAAIRLAEESNTYFHAAGDTLFRDCDLDISGGIFDSRAKELVWENCRITVGERGYLETECTNLSLLEGTSMENMGNVSLSSWFEHVLTVQGQVTNHGTLMITIPAEIAVPIDNQGTLFYNESANVQYRFWFGRDILDISQITGNAPVSMD